MELKNMLFCCFMAAAASAAAGEPTSVTWQSLGNSADHYTHRFTIKGDMGSNKLAFNMLPRRMTPVNPSDTITELIPGYYTISSPRFASGADSVIIDIITPGTLANRSYAPDGLHMIHPDGTVSPVDYTRLPLERPQQWSAPGKADLMPYGPQIYDINQAIAPVQPGPYDVVPSYKSVTLTGGYSSLPLQQSLTVRPMQHPGEYEITVANNKVTVAAADMRTAMMAMYSFDALVLSNAPADLPNAIITDYPDHPYRGLMIDVSRNFQPISQLYKIINYMAEYRMNRLHLHLVDDEAWRIEIPQLPELTDFAGKRGYSPDESICLYQTYSGDGNPQTEGGSSNGFYTRDEFIGLLRYAHDHGIQIIPEIDMPGHARAAIKAMEKRYRDTGDSSLRLIHDADTSVYTSAQGYHDNAINPALESTYRFLGIIFDAIKSMYDAAEVTLPAIHIGGDEVARGAWSGSEQAQRLISERGLNGQTGLHAYFVERVAEMLRQRGIKMSGWQEIAVGHDQTYNQAISPMTYSVNCWTQSTSDPAKSFPSRAARAGFPVVLSNVNHFYLDMIYNHHPEEPGLKWGGTVDEFQSLHGYPSELCPEAPDGKIIGVSGHLFAETLRSPEMLEMYIFPKMLGLAERAWNAKPTYTDAEFNAVICNREIPRWDREGRNYHLRQPGIRKVGDRVEMNSPYPRAEIRYTLDGSEPTATSPLYIGSITVPSDAVVKARLFYGGKQSAVTYLSR